MIRRLHWLYPPPAHKFFFEIGTGLPGHVYEVALTIITKQDILFGVLVMGVAIGYKHIQVTVTVVVEKPRSPADDGTEEVVPGEVVPLALRGSALGGRVTTNTV